MCRDGRGELHWVYLLFPFFDSILDLVLDLQNEATFGSLAPAIRTGLEAYASSGDHQALEAGVKVIVVLRAICLMARPFFSAG